MNNFYIYFHINPLKNEVFYVGMGSGRRARVKSNRSASWKRVVAKYGYVIDIVETNLTQEEAITRERFYISFFGRRDLGKGNLVNHTDGGEQDYEKRPKGLGRPKGSKNSYKRKSTKMSQETRDKIGSFWKGKRKFSEEQKRQIAEKVRKSKEGKSYPAWNKGISPSQETRDKISEAFRKKRQNK